MITNRTVSMIGTVVTIPQDNWYKKSFNLVVPLSIQGKPCEIIEESKSPNTYRGSMNMQISVEGKSYSVPRWAVCNRQKVVKTNIVA